MTHIQSALTQLFNKHRIVFWYDTHCELRGEFESLLLPGIELIELSNNEFNVKYRILRQQPDQKFLIYHEGPAPQDLENWLLDVQLAQGEFRADQIALWLAELGLGYEYTELVQAHAGFFANQPRRLQLKAALHPQDSHNAIRHKMLAICAAAEPRMDDILEILLADLAFKQNEHFQLIQQCNLDAFLWERLGRTFGYQSKTPGIQDFTIELFKSCYALELGQPASFSNDALVFLKRWKDSISQHEVFEILSEQYASLLNIEQDLHKQDFRKLAGMDIFRMIDQKIISDLVNAVSSRTIPASEVVAIIRQRRRGHWYKAFQHIYDTIDNAAQFIKALDETKLTIETFTDGLQRYSQTWYQLDQLHRRTIYHARKSGHPPVLEPLVELIENLYNNNYLLTVNNNWQPVVDAVNHWTGTSSFPLQSQFYENWVNQKFLQNNKKIYVIISDSLRFEVAEDLLSLVRREDRYEAVLEPMLSMLPSYTQLGMAALLPNQALSFADNDTGTVIVDGINSQGTANRDKILKQAIGKASAIRAEDLLSLNRDACRDLVRENDVLYIYHNRIDAVGDKKESEERVFEAVAETLDELLILIKKLTAANATNIIVTADHGFIYQNNAIDESDFSITEVEGKEILYRDRRFALGKGLSRQPGLKSFTSEEVGLSGSIEIQFPKSINRLRLKGSGSRYVHGGASLQEIVLPVLQINKKRESDISKVRVEILKSASTLITSGQISVTFYQVDPVSDKVQPRKLRAGIYTTDGKLISDSHEMVFDFEQENAREREIPVRFLLTKESNKVNNQEVILKLEEQIEDTTHYQLIQSIRYTMRRSFTSDF